MDSEPAGKSILLTQQEALAAVGIDLRHYGPQKDLLIALAPLVLGPRLQVCVDSRHEGVWLPTSPKGRLRWLAWEAFRDFIRRTLDAWRPSPALLAKACGLVFGGWARVETGADGLVRIRVATRMEGFICRQCGRCCRSLDYHQQCTFEDIRNWQRLGRIDILEWVAVYRDSQGHESYRIWTRPGTRQTAPVCPWLKPLRDGRCWICTIHDVKPAICRQYPGSRKHGEMTGCIGFS